MTLIVRHKVRDYEAWKPVFDETESLRTSHGLLSHIIYRTNDDPNDLTIEFQVESREGAQQLMGDPELAEAMQRGGVIGELLVIFLEKVERVIYEQRMAA